MVGLDQSLESDLGIDSIKRIEVVGAMLQALPERYREALSASRSKLNTQATLEGMLSMMSAAGAEGAASLPFDVAGAETQAVQSLPSRHVVAAEAESIDASALRRITPGHFLITEDTLGLATQVASLLMERSCTSTLVPATCSPARSGCSLDRRARCRRSRRLPASSISRPRAPRWEVTGASGHRREQLFRHEKSLFLLLRGIRREDGDDAHVLSLSALGGGFGRQPGFATPASACRLAVSACSSRCAKSGRRCASRRSMSIPRSAAAFAAELMHGAAARRRPPGSRLSGRRPDRVPTGRAIANGRDAPRQA